MKRIPVIPTIVVALAVAVMIALGLWQLLDRRPKKEAFLRQLATNPAQPPIAWPRQPDDTLLFRRTGALCREPVSTRIAGAGSRGYRIIATCRPEIEGSGIEGPGLQVQLGTTRDPNATVAWRGGAVTGYISRQPDTRSIIAALFDRTPTGFMIVADRAPAGLTANAPANIDSVPNSHLAYAGQWFAFAAIASVIYTLALRRRVRPQGPGSGQPG